MLIVFDSADWGHGPARCASCDRGASPGLLLVGDPADRLPVTAATEQPEANARSGRRRGTVVKAELRTIDYTIDHRGS